MARLLQEYKRKNREEIILNQGNKEMNDQAALILLTDGSRRQIVLLMTIEMRCYNFYASCFNALIAGVVEEFTRKYRSIHFFFRLTIPDHKAAETILVPRVLFL